MKRRWALILLICVLALGLRLQHASTEMLDWDEPVYVEAATTTARHLRQGDLWAALTDSGPNPEHPALAKHAMALGVTVVGPEAPLHLRVAAARLVNVVAGVAQVGLLAALCLPAGLLLAVQSSHIKYTSQAYLEATPGLFALLALVLWLRAGRSQGLLSGLALGAAVAGKFLHGLVALPLGWAVYKGAKPHRWAWLMGAAGAFLVLNPLLWPGPISWLGESLAHHWTYPDTVAAGGLSQPWWRPLQTVVLGPGEAWALSLDPIIAVLGLVGLVRVARGPKEHALKCDQLAALWRLAALWLLAGLALLCLWPTRWPQHVCTVLPALCLLGGGYAQGSWGPFPVSSEDESASV